MPVLTLIRGLPGSGKTTLAKALNAAAHHSIHLEADFWMTDGGGDYCFNPTRLPEVHDTCQSATELAMMTPGVVNVIVANTFCQGWEVVPYLHLAERYGWTVQLLQCDGNYPNVHGVTPEKIEQMRARFVPFRDMLDFVQDWEANADLIRREP